MRQSANQRRGLRNPQVESETTPSDSRLPSARMTTASIATRLRPALAFTSATLFYFPGSCGGALLRALGWFLSLVTEGPQLRPYGVCADSVSDSLRNL